MQQRTASAKPGSRKKEEKEKGQPVKKEIELGAPPDVCMDSVLVKLAALSYQTEFCGRYPSAKPVTRYSFSTSPPSAAAQAEQLRTFLSLAGWLMAAAGGPALSAPAAEPDGDECVTRLLQEARASLGLGTSALERVRTQLVAGRGAAVTSLLGALCDAALERQGFSWQPAEHGAGCGDDDDDDDDIEDVEDEDEEGGSMSGGWGAWGSIEMGGDDDGPGSPGPPSAAQQQRRGEAALPQVRVDPEAWRAECERVAPDLRLAVSEASRDWRTNLRLMRQCAAQLPGSWADARPALLAVHKETSSALDKVTNRSTFLNTHFGQLVWQYQSAREAMAAAQQAAQQAQDAAATADEQLEAVTQELKERNAELEARSAAISDTTPLVAVKEAVAGLRRELRGLDVRVGVLQHTLLQVSSRNASQQQQASGLRSRMPHSPMRPTGQVM